MATYQEILRSLVVNDRTLIAERFSSEGQPSVSDQLEERDRCISRVAAITAHDGPVQTFRWTIGDALDAGITPDEIVGVMLAIAPLVGIARIVDTAPKVALALDYDLDADLEALAPVTPITVVDPPRAV